MKRYIGTKLIAAVAMTRAAYNDFRGWTLPANENGADDGYLVEYLDGGKPNVSSHAGYVSWSPKEQFEAAYRPCHEMTFGLALEAMKRGDSVARTGWNGKGMWLALGAAHPGLEAAKFWNPHARQHAVDAGGQCAVQAYIIMKTAQGDIQMGWAPTQSDVLAEDWAIVNTCPAAEAPIEAAPAITRPAHQQRVVTERDELAEKITKLAAFLPTATYQRLADEEQTRLANQLDVMRLYCTVLNQRIDAFPS
jgi:hypothetical protein